MENYYIAYTCSVQTQFDAEGFINYLQNNFKYSNQDDICSLIQNSIHPNEFENFLNCHEKSIIIGTILSQKVILKKKPLIELLTFTWRKHHFRNFSQIHIFVKISGTKDF